VRGSPLIRALFAFCLIAALGWPLWHLTHRADAVTPSVAVSPSQVKAIGLQLDFTTVPKRFVVKHLEKDVWREEVPAAAVERSIPMVFPEKGVDLVLHIEWAEEPPLAAVRVRLTDPAGETHEKSVWGHGTVDEVLTFP
jgi:hypothetical protein